MTEPLWPLVASLLGTDDLLGGHFLESSSYILALQEPRWHCPSGGDRWQAAHREGLGLARALVHLRQSNEAFPSFSVSFSADTCGDLLVTLQSLSRQGEKRSLQLSGKVNSMAFMFDSVLPGKYKGETCRRRSRPSLTSCLARCSETQLPNFTPTLHLYLFNSSLPLDLECA